LLVGLVRLAAEVRRGLKQIFAMRVTREEFVRLAAEVRRGLKPLYVEHGHLATLFASLLK